MKLPVTRGEALIYFARSELSSLRFLDADRSFLVTFLTPGFLVSRRRNTYQEKTMDLVYLAAVALFFALLIGFAVGCARLGGAQ